MHGAGRIVASRQWTRKIFWIISIMATLAVLTWQVHTLYRLYQNRPLSTHVAIEHDTSLLFPAITICGMNALRADEVERFFSESLRREIEERFTMNSSSGREGPRPSTDPLEQLTEEDEQGGEYEGEQNGEQGVGGEEGEHGGEGDDDGMVPDENTEGEFIDREYVRAIIAQQNASLLTQIGHQFEDFVVYCTFRGAYCANYSSTFWSRFWHFAYGNCYVFNGGATENGKNAKILKSNEPGPSYGLSLELNIEQNQYIEALTQSAGVRIDISDQGQMPFPLDKGLSLAPGYETSIGMRKVVINRRDPFSRNTCVNHSTSDGANIYNRQTMKVNYSTTACKKSCWASSQHKMCGCMEYKFPRPADTPLCDIVNKTIEKCLKKVKDKFTKGKLSCSNSCPPPCRESTFKLTTSYSLWPTKTYEDYYKIELVKRTKEVDWSDNFRANVLKVDIFFEELNYEVISEELSYELPNFMSDLGGSLGLWIGVSVLTVAEIFELLLLTCLALGRRLKRGINEKSSTIAVEKFAE
ncbi:hypothetical protein ACROYT_G000186 [Oculina patagonica]